MSNRIQATQNRIRRSSSNIAARTAPARSNLWESYAPVWEEHAQAWEEMGEGRRTKTNPTSKSKGNYILRVISVNAGFLDVIGHTGIAVFSKTDIKNYRNGYHFYNAGGSTRYSNEGADEHGLPIYSKENPNTVIVINKDAEAKHQYLYTMMDYLVTTKENVLFTDWEVPDIVAIKLIEIIEDWNVQGRDYIKSDIPNCAQECQKMIAEAYVNTGANPQRADVVSKVYVPSFFPRWNEQLDIDAKAKGAIGTYRHYVNEEGDLDVMAYADRWEEEGVYEMIYQY